MALLFFVALANLVTIQYALGAARGAVDEGSRAGALSGGNLEICEAFAGSAVANLLAGSIGDDISINCVFDGELIVARARGSFAFWLPGPPPFEFEVSAGTTLEPEP